MIITFFTFLISNSSLKLSRNYSYLFAITCLKIWELISKFLNKFNLIFIFLKIIIIFNYKYFALKIRYLSQILNILQKYILIIKNKIILKNHLIS